MDLDVIFRDMQGTWGSSEEVTPIENTVTNQEDSSEEIIEAEVLSDDSNVSYDDDLINDTIESALDILLGEIVSTNNSSSDESTEVINDSDSIDTLEEVPEIFTEGIINAVTPNIEESEDNNTEEEEETTATELPAVVETVVSEDLSQYGRFKGAPWYNIVKSLNITLAGLGGIGSWLSIFLARLGVNHMTLYDADVFNEVNMSGQLLTIDSINRFKVESAQSLMWSLANYTSVDTVASFFTETSEGSDVMLCGFDSMSARKTYYYSWKNRVQESSNPKEMLFIDGRLTAELFQIFTIQGDDEYVMNEYENSWLFSDNEADVTDCTFKQTSHLAAMIGTYMTTNLVNWANNLNEDNMERRVPWFMEYNSIFNLHEYKF